MVSKPLSGLGIAQVQELAPQQPFGMMRREPGSAFDPLGFEPHDEFHVAGMDIIANGLQALGEALAGPAPRSPPAATRCKDTSRHPSTSNRA